MKFSDRLYAQKETLRFLGKKFCSVSRPRVFLSALFLLFLILFPAISEVGWAESKDVSPPKRIVSLSPGITEILFAIGAGDRVVGVTDYSGGSATVLHRFP